LLRHDYFDVLTNIDLIEIILTRRHARSSQGLFANCFEHMFSSVSLKVMDSCTISKALWTLIQEKLNHKSYTIEISEGDTPGISR